MKILKHASLLACCALSLLLASCLGDDNKDTGLSQEQVNQCINAVKGDYSGDLIYESINPVNPNDKTDSVDIDCRIERTDTAVIASIYGFPPSLIAKELEDSAMKVALAEVQPVALNAAMAFYQDSPMIAFLMYPMPVKYTVSYGGAAHEVAAYFYSGQYSYGIYSATKKQMQMQLVLGGVYLDDNLNKNLIKAAPAFIANFKW